MELLKCCIGVVFIFPTIWWNVPLANSQNSDLDDFTTSSYEGRYYLPILSTASEEYSEESKWANKYRATLNVISPGADDDTNQSNQIQDEDRPQDDAPRRKKKFKSKSKDRWKSKWRKKREKKAKKCLKYSLEKQKKKGCIVYEPPPPQLPVRRPPPPPRPTPSLLIQGGFGSWKPNQRTYYPNKYPPRYPDWGKKKQNKGWSHDDDDDDDDEDDNPHDDDDGGPHDDDDEQGESSEDGPNQTDEEDDDVSDNEDTEKWISLKELLPSK